MIARPAPPVWRSILYVPGNVPKFIDKAHERGADCVLVDLEDSVQPAQKPAARAMLGETIRKVAANSIVTGWPIVQRRGRCQCATARRSAAALRRWVLRLPRNCARMEFPSPQAA